MIVYLIRNKKNGRLYVGKTVGSLADRWYQHVWRAKNRPQVHCMLHRAIRSYGAEAFEISELAKAESAEQLNSLEKHFIKCLNTYPPSRIGYNLTPGGDGKAAGTTWMPGQREKFVAKMKGRFKGKENPMYGRGKFGSANPMFGKITSEETKEKIRTSLRPKRLGSHNPFFGHRHDDKHIRKMSNRMSGSRNPMFGKNGSENARKSWISRRRNRAA
jgi:group I intron endonuclease